MKLLLSVYQPQSGNIQIETEDGSLTLSELPSGMFAYVPQGNTILSGTIAENMRMVKEDATDEEKNEANLVILDYLEVFENVAWLFCKEGGESVGNSPEEWLDSIEGMFSIYEAMPTIIELWIDNQATTSNPKNREGQR